MPFDSPTSHQKPLTPVEQQELQQQLLQISPFDLVKTHGLFCAILSGPRFVSMRHWLFVITGKTTLNPKIKQKILPLLLRLKYQLAENLQNRSRIMPLIQVPQNSQLITLDALTPTQKYNIEQWCEGYLRGVFITFKQWLPKGNREIASILLPILLLCQGEENSGLQELASYFQEKISPEEVLRLKQQREQAIILLPDLIALAYNYWHPNSNFLEA